MQAATVAAHVLTMLDASYTLHENLMPCASPFGAAQLTKLSLTQMHHQFL